MESLKDAVSRLGVVAASAALTAAMGKELSPQRLSNWGERGVPIEHAAVVEKVLGVPRWTLRPEDWHRIWPELVGAPGAPAIAEAGA